MSLSLSGIACRLEEKGVRLWTVQHDGGNVRKHSSDALVVEVVGVLLMW